MQMLLLLTDVDGVPCLCSPAVGTLVALANSNEIISANDVVAEISILGVRHPLIAPATVQHRIAFADGLNPSQGVAYLQVIASLATVIEGAESATEVASEDLSELCILSPQAGRFYHRPTADAETFVNAGETISAGKTIGLLEVMKTFSPVKWNPAPGNPQTAVVVKYRIADGNDVEDAQPLLDLDVSS